MLNPNIVTARDIARNYKKVFDNVKKTNEPAVVMTQRKPQVAIVSLEDLEKLQHLRYKNSAKTLLDVAYKAHELLKNEKLPKDLSQNHDYYAWGGRKKS